MQLSRYARGRRREDRVPRPHGADKDIQAHGLSVMAGDVRLSRLSFLVRLFSLERR